MRTLLNCSFLLFLGLIFLALFPAQSQAETQESYSTISFQFENDAFFDTDAQYSNGMFFSYIVPLDSSEQPDDNNESKLLELHHFIYGNPSDSRKSASFSFGQNIYTPDDTENTELIEDDRPYAGLSYMSVGLHNQEVFTMRTLELDFGMVGRHSYAEDTQRVIHDLLAWDIPKGWEHQLEDEFFVGLTFEQRWKLTNEGGETGFGFELIPHIGGSIGTAFINGYTGTELRIGWNLPHDYGSARIRQGSRATTNPNKLDPSFSTKFSRVGFHVFGSVDGEASIRNILLDGNTLVDSHSVAKKNFVLTYMMGVGLSISRYKLTFAHVYKTRQFNTQGDDLKYGSVSLSCSF